jgi:hypothetical protein
VHCVQRIMVGFLEALSPDNKWLHIKSYTVTFLYSDSFTGCHHVVTLLSPVPPCRFVSFHVSGHFFCSAFLIRWVGRADTVLWLSRSTDFTSLDFFSFGPCKVFETRIIWKQE